MKRTFYKFCLFLDDKVERKGIDGLINGIGKAVNYGSRQIRLLQGGHAGSYFLLMVLGILILFAIRIFS